MKKQKKIRRSKSNQTKRKQLENQSKNTLLYLLIVLTITFIANSPSLQNGFTNWDDPNYIINNPLIKDFNADNIKKIFTEVYFANYQPLHIFSYLIEYQFFELDPKGYHFISLLMHLIATALVFILLNKLSSNTLLSLAGALWFGAHPLHVESVAWASERKDLLYSIFFFAGMICYINFIKLKNTKWLYYTFGLFILSVFSKAMAVAFVPVLILIDLLYERKLTVKVWLEKLPFFVLALIMGLVSVNASKEAESISTYELYTFSDRIFFASHNLLQYAVKLIYPFNQSAYYAYPVKGDSGIPFEYYLSFPIALAIAVYAIWNFKRDKRIFFAITFFVLTLFLVLMLLPVGPTIYSERYSYIPSVGLFFLAIIYLEKLFSTQRGKSIKQIATGLSVIYLAILSYKCFERTKVWKDSFTLWEDVIKTQPMAAHAYSNLGDAYFKTNNDAKAIEYFTKAIEIDEKDAMAYYNRANAYGNSGNVQAALNDLNNCIALDSNNSEAFNKRGAAKAMSGDIAGAFDDFNRVIKLDPNNSEVYFNMGLSMLNSGKKTQACEYFSIGADLGHTKCIQAFSDLCK